MDESLIVFAKKPILGTVKTRLAKTLGEEVTLSIYRQLLQITFGLMQSIRQKSILYWEGEIPEDSLGLGTEFPYAVQIQGDLGQKMESAFQNELKKARSVCIIGTDCPEITNEIIDNAFRSLNQYDVVIGPAKDGGYYLLGMKEMVPILFIDVPWSTNLVFSITMERLNSQNKSVYVLPMLSDLDEESDLNYFIEQQIIVL
ncbi:transferase 1, rSAM/selenodomain-associated [Leptospira ryugenii]|uniref:Transferase 1, rSAM/selenodomain-associated n=1 Tax=Leptospira ryugenii TaxID=1917863 RepID=A0A2P2E1D3_9LEPT|nr:TIGR04282 family arsenosugar biosynthesis glycosyltransferase [Leptospira ryugenii]GBF50674.1 transferase 1, rSAM/selenodomain-associated [Leptospira ryugenii]